MEREKKINWLSLFIKIIIIFIFILIIIWLFTKIFNKDKLSDTFKNNITNMETVATNYYKTVDLPLDKGKSLKMTLGEMIEKGLIVSVNDNEGISCNTSKSLSKIVRKKSNYVLYTTLKCGREQNTISKKISLKDCKNCQVDKSSETIDNQSQTENSENNSINTESNNKTNDSAKGGTTYYEYVKETITYTKWMKGDLAGEDIENKYEYYGIAKKTYYSIGVVKASDFYEGNKITYTLKINSVPRKDYYFTKIDDSAYFNSTQKDEYTNENGISLSNNYSIANNFELYALTEDNFTYTLTPYYRKGSFYIDVEINIKNTNNVSAYSGENTNIYYVPLKITVKYISSQLSETKPNGEYETITYYRYKQTNRDVIWSSDTYVEGYTKTGNTEIR